MIIQTAGFQDLTGLERSGDTLCIAVPSTALQRETINLVVLQMYQDGMIEALQNKWFGSP